MERLGYWPKRLKMCDMRLALLDYPGALRISLEGIDEILAMANREAGRTLFEVRRFQVGAWAALSRFLGRNGNRMLVVGLGRSDALKDLLESEVPGRIRILHERGVVPAGICMGNFALAQAGLLDGREGTTHWSLGETFRARFPQVKLRLDRLLLDHGDCMSVGGMTAFMDLCLFLAAREGGRGLALRLARLLQVDPQRESQLPYLEPTPLPASGEPGLERLLDLLKREPERPWNREDMAHLAAMSPRTLERRFRELTGAAPGQWLQELRLAKAREALEGGASVAEACERTGWQDLSSFVRRFRERVGMTPARYRAWTRGR